MMKPPRLLAPLVAALSFFALSLHAGDPDKEVTIRGEGMCAKCALKESDSCQNVIQVTKKDGKVRTVYLAKNDVSKSFHKHLCKSNARVVATGKISKDEHGHKVMTASKIDLDT